MSTPALRAPSASDTSASSSDWLGTLIVAAKAMTGVGECLPFPFVKGFFSTSVVLLELIEKVGTNEDDLRDLAKSVFNTMECMRDELNAHGEASAPRFEATCKEFTMYLDKITSELGAMQHDKPGFRKRLKKYLKASSISGKIQDYRRQFDELRTNLALVTATGTRLELSSVRQEVVSVHQEVVTIRSDISSLARRIVNPTLSHDNFRTFMEGDIYLLSASRTHSIRKCCTNKCQSILSKVATDYRAYIGEGNTVKTVRIFEGRSAQKWWEKSLTFHASHPRHPALAQLFGMCKSLGFLALVFHEDLVSLEEYTMMLPTAVAKVDFEGNMKNDYKSALSYLNQLDGIAMREIDLFQYVFVNSTTGRLCVSHLLDNYDADMFERYFSLLWMLKFSDPTNHPRHLSPDSLPLGFRHANIPLLMHHYHTLNTLARPSVGYPFTGRPGDVYLHNEYTSKPHLLAYIPTPTRWKDPFWYMDHRCSASQAPAGPGWTRFSVSFTPDLCRNTELLAISTWIDCDDDDGMRSSWLAQAHSIYTASNPYKHGWDLDDIFLVTQVTLYLTWQLVSPFDPFSLEGTFMAPGSSVSLPDQVFVFIEDPPVDHNGRLGLPRIYWETDPPTAKAEMLQAGGYTVRASAKCFTHGYRWEPHHYLALRDFHRECGIDPDSNEGARLLGLPLAQLSSLPVPEKVHFTGEESKYLEKEEWEIQEELGPHSLLDCNKYSEFKIRKYSPCGNGGSCNFEDTNSSDRKDDSQSESQDEAPDSMSFSNPLKRDDPPTDNLSLAKGSIVEEYRSGSNALPHLLGNSSLGWTILILILLIFRKWGIILLLFTLFVHRMHFHEEVLKI